MKEYRIWSDECGGFIEIAFWRKREAVYWLTAMEDAPEDAEVLLICPDHEEQPADACEECFA